MYTLSLKIIILSLLARLASKRLQIGTDMLLITTDRLYKRININDLQRP